MFLRGKNSLFTYRKHKTGVSSFCAKYIFKDKKVSDYTINLVTVSHKYVFPLNGMDNRLHFVLIDHFD
jgi:hypothetical protein